MKPDWFLDSEKSSMKTKYNLFRRGAVFYVEDTATGKQTSLRTKDETEARSLLNAENEAHRQPVLNLQLARAYLSAYATHLAKRHGTFPSAWQGKQPGTLHHRV